MVSLYEIPVRTLRGEPFDMTSLRGRKVLLVNTASECGYTPQLAQLQELHENYAAGGLRVIGVPCNDFGHQEPGTAGEIEQFCELNYGVSFTLLEKSVCKAGPQQHPLFRWLQHKSENGTGDFEITWNFQKYCISEKGHIEHVIAPARDALDPEILQWITQHKLF